MVQINKNYDKLGAGYLFPEIAKRTKQFMSENPNAEVMKLGIGDTTEPLTYSTIQGLKEGVSDLAVSETYSGYGDEQGSSALRQRLTEVYKSLGVELDPSEVFVSDGAKPDSANIQSIFGLESVVAVQDPAYPVYVDTNVIAGRTGAFDKATGQYEGIVYMACNEGNNFFPELPDKKVDLIYICNPNNPTGTVASKEQLKTFVDFAKENKAVIVYDAAYAEFIKDKNLPKSIYEVEGAKDCAIELNSFSKFAGYTGVRLGWSVVPKDLVVEGTEEGKVNSLWNRRQSTFFNGASNIIQKGGLGTLSPEGMEESQKTIDFYLENGKIIKEGIDQLGLTSFGGTPYIWLQTPDKMGSWDFFDKVLNEANVVGTPGAGFGPSGEGYFRLSPFGKRENIEKAVESLTNNLKL